MSCSGRGFFIFANTIALFLSASALFAEPRILSQPWTLDEEVEIRQKWNNRADGFISEKFRGWQPLYHWDVPVYATHDGKQIEVFGFLMPQEEWLDKWIYTARDGRLYKRIYALKIAHTGVPYASPYEKLRAELGEPEQTLEAAVLPSYNTSLVRDPRTGETAYLKMSLDMDNEGQKYSAAKNNFYQAQDAVSNSHALLHESAIETGDPRFDFLPESRAISFTGKASEAAYLTRSRFPTLALKEDEKLVPLYVLLSSQGLLELSRFHGVTPQMWMEQKFLPQIARFLAYTQYRLGIFLESHGQNLSAVINFKTGEIRRFIAQDIHDIMESPILRLLNGRLPLVETGIFSRPVRSVYNEWTDTNTSARPGDFYRSYTGQIVFTADRDGHFNPRFSVAERARAHQVFFVHFIAEVERLTRISMKDLVVQNQRCSSVDRYFSCVHSSTLRGLTMDAIYTRAVEASLAAVASPPAPAKNWTSREHQVYLNAAANSRVAFLTPSAADLLSEATSLGGVAQHIGYYRPKNFGVFAFDRRNLKLMAYDYSGNNTGFLGHRARCRRAFMRP